MLCAICVNDDVLAFKEGNAVRLRKDGQNIFYGSLLPVNLNLGDMKVMNYMLVENVKHTFNENEHTMDLQFIGGEFIA